MRINLTTLIILLTLLQVSAGTYAQKISLSEKNVPLLKVIAAIERQSGYVFFYDNTDLENTKVSISVTQASINETLSKCFSNLPLVYKIENKTIVISEKEPTIIDKIRAIVLQVTVQGKVVDETGQPLPGVTIKVKGTAAGTTTDSKGYFSITVPDDKTLISFSFIGFETQEILSRDISSGSSIVLKATSTNLKEVVVSKGYYATTQELNTGNVSVVKGEDIQKQPVSDPILALEGRVAGLFISQTSGVPGAYSSVQLRGQNSIPNISAKLITANNPLYIIDGVPFGSGSLTNNVFGGGAVGVPNNAAGQGNSPLGLSPFNNLDPANIENIQVLKDADATAIYGSRGANGVILITTKKGKSGATKVDFDFNQGIGHVASKIALLNTDQYLEMRREAYKNDGISVIPANAYDINGAWDGTRYTDWQKVMIGNTANYSNAHINVSGGTTNTQFLVGGGYSRQTTVYPGDFSDDKAMFNASLNHTSNNQRFHLQFSGSFVKDNNMLPRFDMTRYLTLAPDAPVLYDSNGNLNFQVINGTSTFSNPLASILQTYNSITQTLNNNVNLGYEILPGFAFKVNAGYTRSQNDQVAMYPGTSYAPPANVVSANRINIYGTTSIETWIIEPQLTYHKSISKGNLDVLAGTTFQETINKDIDYFASNFTSDALLSNPANAASLSLFNNSYTQFRYNSVYGRINYNWEDKYLLNVTARRDGSSRFGTGKQFGNFGAVGAGWIFTKEKWLSDKISFLSFGKLRGSYGVTGNDQLQDYYYLSSYTTNSTTIQGVTTITPARITNPDFSWEEVKKLEGSLDLGFLNDKINLSVTYYRNRTENQLIGYPLSTVTGFNVVQFNLPAVIQNSGWEFQLNTTNLRNTDFSWSSSVNLAAPKNKLVSFPNIQNYAAYTNLYTVGGSLFSKKVFQATGVNPQNGLYTFVTSNTSGLPTLGTDAVSSLPLTQKYYGGFQNSLRYKSIQFDILFQFVKQNGRGYLSAFSIPGTVNANQPVYVLNRWQSAGQATDIQRYSTSAALNNYSSEQASTAAVTDASFIRLKNVSISYQLPAPLQHVIHSQNARIYLQAQNLLTFTGYKGLDPETQNLNLPPLRMISVGINATF